MGFRVKVGFKDSVGLQIGQNFPSGTFGVHAASDALGAHGRRRATPLATNCWPKAPRGGGGGRGSWRPRTRGVAPPPRGPKVSRSKNLPYFETNRAVDEILCMFFSCGQLCYARWDCLRVKRPKRQSLQHSDTSFGQIAHRCFSMPLMSQAALSSPTTFAMFALCHVCFAAYLQRNCRHT